MTPPRIVWRLGWTGSLAALGMGLGAAFAASIPGDKTGARESSPAPHVGPVRGEASPSTPMRHDPFAPFRVSDFESIPPQPDMSRNGMRLCGNSSGPINSDEDDRDFFTDPRFDRGGNSGRLYYQQFFLRNPHDPAIPERRAWFVCWSPLEDGHRVQRLPERAGHVIGEVTIDGTNLQVHYFALEGDGEQVDTLRWAGDALGQGRFENVGPVPGMPILDPPPAFEQARDRGYRLLSLRKWKEAVGAFEEALALQAGDAAALFALGVAWEALAPSQPQAMDLALDALNRALQAEPTRSTALQRRAELLERQRRFDEARADLDRIIALAPQEWAPYLDRARVHSSLGQQARAIEDAEAAARWAPAEVAPLEALVLYQDRSGNLPAALAAGRRVLEVDDSRTAVRVTLASAHARLGNVAEALRVYAEAKSNGVTASERRLGIRDLEAWLRGTAQAGPARSAVQQLLAQLRGPDALEAAGEGDR